METPEPPSERMTQRYLLMLRCDVSATLTVAEKRLWLTTRVTIRAVSLPFHCCRGREK